MKNLIIILSLVMLMLPGLSQERSSPNLLRKKDLVDLGKGKIVQTDKSILKDITLVEIRDYSIVYEKKGSQHDLYIASILRIEFPDSKWGFLVIEFKDFKPYFYILHNE